MLKDYLLLTFLPPDEFSCSMVSQDEKIEIVFGDHINSVRITVFMEEHEDVVFDLEVDGRNVKSSIQSPPRRPIPKDQVDAVLSIIKKELN